MVTRTNEKIKSNLENIFIFLITVIIVALLFIFYITIRNECQSLQGEIKYNKSILYAIESRVKILKSEKQIITQRNYIEREAVKRFGMIFPEPESLIVYIKNN